MGIRILLVDDHKIMRDGLKALLEKEPGFEVVAEAADGHAALRIARDVNPDLIIMDVAMPECNGIEASAQIRAALPSAKIIALTMHTDKNYMTGMLRAGTAGYLLKDCAAEELVKAVHEVMAGNGYVSPEIAPLIFADYYAGKERDAGNDSQQLSAREKQILRFVAEGFSKQDIAERLQVSDKTVERARTQIMEKLKLFSIAELTKYAVRQGLSPLT